MVGGPKIADFVIYIVSLVFITSTICFVLAFAFNLLLRKSTRVTEGPIVCYVILLFIAIVVVKFDLFLPDTKWWFQAEIERWIYRRVNIDWHTKKYALRTPLRLLAYSMTHLWLVAESLRLADMLFMTIIGMSADDEGGSYMFFWYDDADPWFKFLPAYTDFYGGPKCYTCERTNRIKFKFLVEAWQYEIFVIFIPNILLMTFMYVLIAWAL